MCLQIYPETVKIVFMNALKEIHTATATTAGTAAAENVASVFQLNPRPKHCRQKFIFGGQTCYSTHLQRGDPGRKCQSGGKLESHLPSAA